MSGGAGWAEFVGTSWPEFVEAADLAAGDAGVDVAWEALTDTAARWSDGAVAPHADTREKVGRRLLELASGSSAAPLEPPTANDGPLNAVLRQAWATLPATTRVVAALERHWQLSAIDLATTLGMPLGQVEQELTTAQAQLDDAHAAYRISMGSEPAPWAVGADLSTALHGWLAGRPGVDGATVVGARLEHRRQRRRRAQRLVAGVAAVALVAAGATYAVNRVGRAPTKAAATASPTVLPTGAAPDVPDSDPHWNNQLTWPVRGSLSAAVLASSTASPSASPGASPSATGPEPRIGDRPRVIFRDYHPKFGLVEVAISADNGVAPEVWNNGEEVPILTQTRVGGAPTEQGQVISYQSSREPLLVVSLNSRTALALARPGIAALDTIVGYDAKAGQLIPRHRLYPLDHGVGYLDLSGLGTSAKVFRAAGKDGKAVEGGLNRGRVVWNWPVLAPGPEELCAGSACPADPRDSAVAARNAQQLRDYFGLSQADLTHKVVIKAPVPAGLLPLIAGDPNAASSSAATMTCVLTTVKAGPSIRSCSLFDADGNDPGLLPQDATVLDPKTASTKPLFGTSWSSSQDGTPAAGVFWAYWPQARTAQVIWPEHSHPDGRRLAVKDHWVVATLPPQGISPDASVESPTLRGWDAQGRRLPDLTVGREDPSLALLFDQGCPIGPTTDPYANCAAP